MDAGAMGDAFDGEDILNEVIGGDILGVAGNYNIVLGFNVDDVLSIFDETLTDDEDDGNDDGRPKERKPRGQQKERHPENSRFMQYVKLAEKHKHDLSSIWDEDTWEGKQFRERFRLPYAIFADLVEEYEKIDPRRSHDIWGHKKSDTRLLIMGTLRVLAQGLPFDLCDELTDITADKHNKFFKTFCKWMASDQMYTKWVKMPSLEDNSVNHVMDYYDYVGLPGAIGSIDCVHSAWDMCPAGLLSDCKGKEGYPTVVHQVIVSHTRKVLAVSGPYYGTWNDKTISRRST